MNHQENTRLRAALLRNDCPNCIVQEAGAKAAGLTAMARQLTREADALAAHVLFASREKTVHYGFVKCYEIKDGETHVYAAESEASALRMHWQSGSYKSEKDYTEEVGRHEVREMPPELGHCIHDDADGTFTVKTYAEWAEEGSATGLISSTAV